MKFKYIEAKADVLGGKPCIKGTRISIDLILEWLANGANKQDILISYPQISDEAFSEGLRYASLNMKNEILIESNPAA